MSSPDSAKIMGPPRPRLWKRFWISSRVAAIWVASRSTQKGAISVSSAALVDSFTA